MTEKKDYDFEGKDFEERALRITSDINDVLNELFELKDENKKLKSLFKSVMEVYDRDCAFERKQYTDLKSLIEKAIARLKVTEKNCCVDFEGDVEVRRYCNQFSHQDMICELKELLHSEKDGTSVGSPDLLVEYHRCANPSEKCERCGSDTRYWSKILAEDDDE